MSIRFAVSSFVLACLVSTTPFAGEDKKEEKPPEFPPKPPVPILSPEEEAKTFQLPPGYRMELVVSDPDIKEPVVCVFDGNGRMYLAEMRSYMQDIEGNNEHAPVGVVSRHDSSRHNGVFDKHTIFKDKVVLPRIVLPLDDRVIIGATDTNDLIVYTDKNNDGIADNDGIPFYEGGPRGGNLEHQPSGLIWAMDNWMYMAGNSYRLRWNDGRVLKEPTASNSGQWGLAQDNYGKVWFSNGGGEISFICFQTHIQYAGINYPDQLPKEFMEVFPATHIPDVQGGPVRFRPDELNLNHFTASCGHEIFRGDRLPKDLIGDPLIGEPVGRLIRRAKIELREGITYLSNPYQNQRGEFIRSSDPNFRPVNMTTGPDGCLYIVDMYRGIIQEGNWVRDGSYLRNVVKQYSLDKNFAHGRIWRLVHKDFKPGPWPHMLEDSSEKLVSYLKHPNGWWRDTAQKLLVLRHDKSIIPDLLKLVRKNDDNFITRLHALWTLEGLDALTADLIREKLKDSSMRVRAEAIRASESLYKFGDKSLVADIEKFFNDYDPLLAVQSLNTAKLLDFKENKKNIQLASLNHPLEGVKTLAKDILNVGKPNTSDRFSQADLNVLKRGGEIYRELCFGCHGYDGHGMPMQGAAPGVTMAPSLENAKILMSHRDAPIHVLLHGLTGLIDGKKFEAQMVPMDTNPDDWIAAAASYVRNSFGNHGAMVTADDVKFIREQTKGRKTPWTVEEMEKMLPQPFKDMSKWKFTASDNAVTAPNAADGKEATRYDSGKPQAAGMWFQIEFPQTLKVCGLRLDTKKSGGDWPRAYKIELSADGNAWGKPVAEGKGVGSITDVAFTPADARFLRITQTDKDEGCFWSIHELQVLEPSPIPLASASSEPPKPAPAAK